MTFLHFDLLEYNSVSFCCKSPVNIPLSFIWYRFVLFQSKFRVRMLFGLGHSNSFSKKNLAASEDLTISDNVNEKSVIVLT